MRERTIQLRRATSLFAYWGYGRLFFHNFALRLTVSARPITCELLDFFSDWRTSQAAINCFADYTPRSVRSAISQLVKHRLLLPKDSPELRQDTHIAKEWSDWLPEGSFHFSTKDPPLADLSSWSLNRLKSILPKTPRPKIFKTVKGAKKMLLPTRAFPESEFARVLLTRKTHREFSKQKLPLETVSQLLSLVWGVTGHLCQTFCLVATWLGLAPFCTAALKDTLIERDLGIDGIRESVLYVAGVGLPAISAPVK